MLAIGITACSESGPSEEPQVIETMVLAEAYTLNIGDEIKKVTSDAKLSIVQNSKNSETDYTLIEGEAEIWRK